MACESEKAGYVDTLETACGVQAEVGTLQRAFDSKKQIWLIMHALDQGLTNKKKKK